LELKQQVIQSCKRKSNRCLGRGSKIKQMRAENVIFMLKKAKNLRQIYHLPPC